MIKPCLTAGPLVPLVRQTLAMMAQTFAALCITKRWDTACRRPYKYPRLKQGIMDIKISMQLLSRELPSSNGKTGEAWLPREKSRSTSKSDGLATATNLDYNPDESIEPLKDSIIGPRARPPWARRQVGPWFGTVRTSKTRAVSPKNRRNDGESRWMMAYLSIPKTPQQVLARLICVFRNLGNFNSSTYSPSRQRWPPFFNVQLTQTLVRLHKVAARYSRLETDAAHARSRMHRVCAKAPWLRPLHYQERMAQASRLETAAPQTVRVPK